MRALYTAATGMAAFQSKIDNIANNLANSNTTGFKKVREGFEDLVYQQMGQLAGEEGASATVPAAELGLALQRIGELRAASAYAVEVH